MKLNESFQNNANHRSIRCDCYQLVDVRLVTESEMKLHCIALYSLNSLRNHTTIFDRLIFGEILMSPNGFLFSKNVGQSFRQRDLGEIPTWRISMRKSTGSVRRLHWKAPLVFFVGKVVHTELASWWISFWTTLVSIAFSPVVLNRQRTQKNAISLGKVFQVQSNLTN